MTTTTRYGKEYTRYMYNDDPVNQQRHGNEGHTKGLVTRPRSVHVAYETLQGMRKEKHLTGFTARCFQHELDHLDGRLFTERVKKGSLISARDGSTVSAARQEALVLV